MAEKQPSKRGAKPLAQAEQVGPDLDLDKLAERSQELVTLGEHQSEVVDQFGDGLPWHPDHYENAIRGELRRGCEAFLRAGRYLVVARECAAHGEWQGFYPVFTDTYEKADQGLRSVHVKAKEVQCRVQARCG